MALFAAVSAIDTNGVSFFKDLRMVVEKRNLEASQYTPHNYEQQFFET